MFSEQGSAVRFRSFTHPAQFSSEQVRQTFDACELYGMCACHAVKVS